MTVVLLGAARRYVGLAGDTKPTTGVPAGSQFYATDTGVEYVYTGAAWVAAPGLPSSLGQKAATASLPVVIASDQVGLIGSGAGAGVGSSSGTITRPNNTTAYAIGDVVGATAAAITFAGFSAKEWLITGIDFYRGASALESGEGSYSLYLYNVTPPSALADNAAFDVPSGDRAAYLGKFDIGTPVDLGGTIRVDTAQSKQITATGTSLYGYLVTNAAYTPQAQSTFVVTLHAVPV